MDLVYFVYGMAFLTMGMAIFLQPRGQSRLRLSENLWLLGAFGLLHGSSEMLDLWTMVHGPRSIPGVLRWSVLTSSYAALFEFGRRLNSGASEGRLAAAARWFTPSAMVASAAAGAYFSGYPMELGGTFSRYLLGFPGGTLVGLGLIRYKRRETHIHPGHPAVEYFDWAGGAFLTYGVLTGVVVAPARFFPADFLNTATFQAATGVPVQLLRAACAVVAAFGMVRILSIFDAEIRDALARALADKVDQLHQSQRMEVIGRLGAGVVHDLNNVLTAVKGSCDMLADAPLDDAAMAEVRNIEEAVGRSQSLARQILNFSRRQSDAPRRIELNAVISGVEDMLGRLLGASYVIEVRLAAASSFIEADPGRIEQVLLNLAINARDAMEGGGRLLIGVERAEHPSSGRCVLLTVADTGSGMTPEVQARLFEPYFTTKPAGKGTGLGLSVVHEIVTRSGGVIEVDSGPGRGTTFKVFLPEAAPTGQPQPARLA